MSMRICDHCHARRAAHRLEMTFTTPYPPCVCDKCLRDVDGRQIAAQAAIDPMPEIRPAPGANSAPTLD